MDSLLINVIIGTVIPLYILIMFSSCVLNGMIVLVFIKTKELHTPSNLLWVHLSAVCFIAPILYSPFSFASFISVMTSCDCNALYYHWVFGHILQFGVYPLNILLLTIGYILILKFSPSILTFSRTIIGLVCIWIVSIVCSIPKIFLVTPDEYIMCCETVCLNGSDLCNTSLQQTFTPRLFNESVSYYCNLRDIFIILVPSAVVFVTSAGSYYIYKKSAIKSSIGLEMRMLLLPVVMTLIGSVYILGQDTINWVNITTTDERVPGITLYVVFDMMWDSNCVMFGLLILFFNVSLRKHCIQCLPVPFSHFGVTLKDSQRIGQASMTQQVTITDHEWKLSKL